MPEFTHDKDNPDLVTVQFSPDELEKMPSSPANDIRINRYMSIEKFEMLLIQKAIWFCRLDKFSDQHEGRSIVDWQSNKNGIKDWWRKSTNASCWNWNNDENFALWNIYLQTYSSGFWQRLWGALFPQKKEGVCIVTTYRKLKTEFNKADGGIEGYFVKYEPHGVIYQGLNSIINATRKYDWYSYEKEFRFIQNVGQHYQKNGELISLDLNIIDEIILSPDISLKGEKAINALIKKAGLTISPSKSKVSDKI